MMHAMTDTWVMHPSLALLAGAALALVMRGHARSLTILAAPLLTLWLVWQVPEGPVWQVQFLDLLLRPLEGDRLGRLFATIFALMAFGGGLFALGQKNQIEVPAAFIYAASAVGVALAGDLITVFICWELMAIGSTLVLWSNATTAAYRASVRYVMIHLAGGAILFAGVAGHVVQTGSAVFGAMQPDTVAHWLILIGFLINAGAPPLSAWVADAYPQASWSGTVFLSAFTTKTAVLVLWRGFPGTELLIGVGLFMVLYGIVYALLENDIRRILVYSVVNQVGFMLVGSGIGTEMALNGAAAHAFTHIIYKGLLLMSAGSVLLMTKRHKCSELGGLFHSMPVTTVCGVIGALAISAFPLTSGFISKSLLVQAAVDQHVLWIWLSLVAASAGAFFYVGIKFPWFVFFQKDSGLRPKDPPASMQWAMVLFAALCIGLGVWPEALYRMLPFPVDYEPYTQAHVLTQLQLLLFSGLAFFLLLPVLKNTLAITLDTDWLYRRLGAYVSGYLRRSLVQMLDGLEQAMRGSVSRILMLVERHHGPEGRLALTWPIRSMALWVLVLLLACLALYYF